jgi:NAD(P)H-hydrate epimerase
MPGALPDWLAPLPDAEAMRGTDRWAIEDRGVPSLDLMERAGAGLARLTEAAVPDGPIAVVCGKGNNGGDGLVAARLLRDLGRAVTVLATGDLRESTPDSRANLERLPGDGVRPFAAGALDGHAGYVDALLGTGFAGEPRGAVAEAIAALNAAGGPVVSADVPSGVDASTGETAGEAVRAAATATFHLPKLGLWVNPGKRHAGVVHVVDIGIPRGAPLPLEGGLIGPEVVGAVPRRGADGTKFDSGHVLVAGGSTGLTGAPSLTALAAARAGAGYVTACVPASLQAIFATRFIEVMTRAVADDDGSFAPAGVETVLAAAERGGALALGPGIGRTAGAVAFARGLAARAPVALVLDADGLNAHAGHLSDLAGRAAPTVCTPHAGELARLLEVDSDEIERRRLHHAREAAGRSGGVLVLKGDDSLVVDPSGAVAVSPGGSPALATAGTGDVLSGVIAALLARRLPAFVAAAAGVWLHAEAGRRAARAVGSAEGVIATDVIAHLPAALGSQ